jgi:hypothetical protein
VPRSQTIPQAEKGRDHYSGEENAWSIHHEACMNEASDTHAMLFAILCQCFWRRAKLKQRLAERKKTDVAAQRQKHAAKERDKQEKQEAVQQEVNKKMQNHELDELGVRTELAALQADFQNNPGAPRGYRSSPTCAGAARH